MKAAILLIVFTIVISVCHGTDTKTIQEKVVEWERALSGKPTNCRRFVDIFIDNLNYHGFFSKPNKTIYGQRSLYQNCEKTLNVKYPHIEAFANGVTYARNGKAAFERTILLINDFGCRITWHGITVIKYDRNLQITDLWDYYDEHEFAAMEEACTLPDDDDEDEDTTEQADADEL